MQLDEMKKVKLFAERQRIKRENSFYILAVFWSFTLAILSLFANEYPSSMNIIFWVFVGVSAVSFLVYLVKKYDDFIFLKHFKELSNSNISENIDVLSSYSELRNKLSIDKNNS